jgi:hypothetical protein
MFICNSPIKIKYVALLGAALTLIACFDVEKVDVTNTTRAKLIIDDFEDGDNVPASTLFGPLSCYAFSSWQSLPTCGVAAGFESNFGYGLNFALEAPPTETSDGIGAGLAIPSAVGTVDIGSYKSLHLDAKIDSGSNALPSAAVFQPGFACGSVHHPPGTVKGGFTVTHDFLVVDVLPLSGQWQSITIALAQFEQPSWQTVRMFDKNECLQLVDALFFNVSSPLASGQSAAGTLTIDNVWLE